MHPYFESNMDKKKAILPPQEKGPQGLGDPNDRRLRSVEKEILIPKIMRDITKNEKCLAESQEFSRCGKEAKLLLTFKCRKENDALIKCSERWYNDENFRSECTELYLNQRAEYRRTGIAKPQQRKDSVTF